MAMFYIIREAGALRLLWIILFCLFSAVLSSNCAWAQTPSWPVEHGAAMNTLLVLRADETEHSPRGAVWRAAVVPGWGQYYNREYLKIPVVYGALGGVIATAVAMNQSYLLHRHAHLYIAWAEAGDPSAYAHYASAYDRLLKRYNLSADTRIPSASLRAHRDKLRRNRDLAYFGIGLVYGLSILDAYVSAHMMDFDVSEDLSIRLVPVPGGAYASLRIKL